MVGELVLLISGFKNIPYVLSALVLRQSFLCSKLHRKYDEESGYAFLSAYARWKKTGSKKAKMQKIPEATWTRLKNSCMIHHEK